ncbi:MAG: ArsR/SmtB family transcription factor [Mobilitalea sp.]
MAKEYELDADNEELLCDVGKALSSPMRIKILKLLYYNSFNIGEISEKLNIPPSSTGVHIKILESAGLINTELQPGSRGAMKLCSRKNDKITIRLKGNEKHINKIKSFSMPIGAYTDCRVEPTCGLAGLEGYIGLEDNPSVFFNPERMDAQIVWSSGGYLEYKFPNPLPDEIVPKRLTLSFESCSEAPNFREDWRSDITVRINQIHSGTWSCPGDFGSRRGRLNPEWWENGTTQHGILTTWEVTLDGTYINGDKTSDNKIEMLEIGKQPFITVRIGNEPGAEYAGGFNIFGDKFGDFEQNIVLTLEY